MRNACSGSRDKSPVKEVLWKIVPYRLFFGRDRSVTWGPGGVAFLNPESNNQDKAYMCLYRITYVINLVLSVVELLNASSLTFQNIQFESPLSICHAWVNLFLIMEFDTCCGMWY